MTSTAENVAKIKPEQIPNRYTERKSHVMDLVTDRAIALFAGINVVPEHSYLAAYSSRKRKSHVMDLVTDRAIALFAGINVVPKRSYLAAYSSRIDHKVCLRFMEAWLEQVEQSGLPHGSSFDLDFHSVPANSAQEPLEKHYVSSRSRSQKGILVFLARDAEQRVLRYANAGVTKGEQADEILQFVRFWRNTPADHPPNWFSTRNSPPTRSSRN